MADSSQASFKAEAADRKAFGERLRASIPAGMKLADFASEIGAGLSTLQSWMSGKSGIGRENLGRILQITGVSATWLISGEGEMRPGVGTPTLSAPIKAEGERDADLYGRVLEAISAVYKELGWGKSLRDLGIEAARIADDLSADGLAEEDKPAAVRAAAAMLRRQLREAVANPSSEASSKSQA